MLTLVRAALINLWLFISCLIGILISPFFLRSGNLNWITARLFAWGALRLAGIKVRVEGLELLEKDQPCIYVANHQSGLDVAIFGSFLPHRTVAIGKIELLWIPFFGQYFWLARNVIIKRQDRAHSMAGLAKAVDAIRHKRMSIFIFPEGTRNRTAEILQPFKKGAFHMAIDAQAPIVPIVVQSLRQVVDWKSGRLRGGTVRIRVLPAIRTEGMGKQDLERLSALTRERVLEAIHGLA